MNVFFLCVCVCVCVCVCFLFFFALKRPLYDFFFWPVHEYFLGLLGVHLIFPVLREHFFVLLLPPNKFSDVIDRVS